MFIKANFFFYKKIDLMRSIKNGLCYTPNTAPHYFQITINLMYKVTVCFAIATTTKVVYTMYIFYFF